MLERRRGKQNLNSETHLHLINDDVFTDLSLHKMQGNYFKVPF